MLKSIAIIEAPSILGLRSTGVEHLPDALVSAGLLARLHARHAGRVSAPMYRDVRDRETGFLNPQGIADYSCRLAEPLTRCLAKTISLLCWEGTIAFCLGRCWPSTGAVSIDCSSWTGTWISTTRKQTLNGEAASSELALVMGRGPALLTTYGGRCSLVRDEDIVAFGFRDEKEAQSYGSPSLPAKMKAIGLEEVRRMGVAAALQEALAYASGQGTREFWIHFDADVLDDTIMPAVDYRLPGGLTWVEIEHVLSAALAHPGAVGMEITIFNPRLDTDGKVLSAFLNMLTSAFRNKCENRSR